MVLNAKYICIYKKKVVPLHTVRGIAAHKVWLKIVLSDCVVC